MEYSPSPYGGCSNDSRSGRGAQCIGRVKLTLASEQPIGEGTYLCLDFIAAIETIHGQCRLILDAELAIMWAQKRKQRGQCPVRIGSDRFAQRCFFTDIIEKVVPRLKGEP